jgi:hypothetical protein
MLHQNVLLRTRITELEEQVEALSQRKTRKRKQVQHGGTMEYGQAASYVATELSRVAKRTKKSSGGGRTESAQPGQRRCRNCGKTGHNARTCQKDTETSSESDYSSAYVGSIVDSE